MIRSFAVVCPDHYEIDQGALRAFKAALSTWLTPSPGGAFDATQFS